MYKLSELHPEPVLFNPLVVQWIERGIPDPVMRVRFLPGGHFLVRTDRLLRVS